MNRGARVALARRRRWFRLHPTGLRYEYHTCLTALDAMFLKVYSENVLLEYLPCLTYQPMTGKLEDALTPLRRRHHLDHRAPHPRGALSLVPRVEELCR